MTCLCPLFFWNLCTIVSYRVVVVSVSVLCVILYVHVKLNKLYILKFLCLPSSKVTEFVIGISLLIPSIKCRFSIQIDLEKALKDSTWIQEWTLDLGMCLYTGIKWTKENFMFQSLPLWFLIVSKFVAQKNLKFPNQ